MKKRTVIVLDCGATNVRAVAVAGSGEILAYCSRPNNTQSDPYYPGGLIWDVDELWGKLISATRELFSKIHPHDVIGLTITTFGVDGAPVLKTGELLYPVISWACQRTAPVMEAIGKYIPLERLYEISGINTFGFNTINKLIWFRENRPEVLDRMDHFVFLPSIFIHRLTGEFITDTTMAGTSMMTDLRTREFSGEILDAIGVGNKFPRLVEPGTVAGRITPKATAETGIPEGIPVYATGHDTQFALLGSGANEHDVVLSSGTWEVLMARTSSVRATPELLRQGVTIEFDAEPGLYNPGLHWLGSGILEWIRKLFYCNESTTSIYDLMITEAEKVDATPLRVGLDFLNQKGLLSGLGIHTKREEVYRAALEALAQKTKQSLKILESAGGFTAGSIIVVGGGSRNRLWNSIREYHLGVPVKPVSQQETTVLGAARMVFNNAI